MASLINPYFPKDTSIEQTLFEGIKTESIKVMGRTYYYLPREIIKENLIFGEDILSKFTKAIPIEMYMRDSTGFAGDKEMYSKFGLEIHNSYQLVVAVSRWEAEVANQTALNAYAPNRPQEGDLIYDPLTQFLMEIKFVDHDAEFYQIGKNYLYHLSCEAFIYSSEDIDTGIAEIDIFENNSLDLYNRFYELSDDVYLSAEDGKMLQLEDDTNLPFRTYGVDTDVQNATTTHRIINPFE